MTEQQALRAQQESLYYFSWNNGTMLAPSISDYMHITKEMLVPQGLPNIVVFCESHEDVLRGLQICKEYKLRAICRSGGHSTAGYSSDRGVIIDVSRMNKVCIDAANKTMIVHAGATAGKISKELDKYQLHVTSGGCGTVGIAGYMQGGGYGYTAREFGMNCDNVLSVTVMLANGCIVVANKSQNEDLFWAIRGGTGGNFGILLDITYQLHELGLVWGFALRWKIASAPAALVELQKNYMRYSTSPIVNYQAVMASVSSGADGKREPSFVMLGMFNGPQTDGEKAIESLLGLDGTERIFSKNSSYAALNDELFGLLNAPTKSKDVALFPLKRCGYIDKQLNLEEWQVITDFFTKTPNAFNLIAMEPYGGTINQRSLADSAFIHRDVFMDLFANSYYDEKGEITSKQDAEDWFKEFEELMSQHYSEHRYQNYPTRGFANYRWAYWGDAFNTLLFVKQKYDPDDFFTFEQGISPYPQEKNIKQSGKASLFSDLKIIY